MATGYALETRPRSGDNSGKEMAMAKSIVVCLDGTWNRPGKKEGDITVETNVFKMFTALAEKPGAQIRFYHEGVGVELGQKLRGGAFGFGLFEQIKVGYGFLVEKFEPGDSIYLFGFSRGAYSARSLAGFIARCGVIRRDAENAVKALDLPEVELAATDDDDKLDPPNAVDKAFVMYKHAYGADNDPAVQKRRAEVEQFKAQFAHDTPIRMVGVWDTVGSLGIPPEVLPGLLRGGARQIEDARFGFLDTRLSPLVQAAYHALAIDERRKPFLPTLWDDPRINAPDQPAEQVWFVGAHSNVGGGYADAGLSNIALSWMIERGRLQGLVYADDQVAGIAAARNPNGLLRDSLAEFSLVGGKLPPGPALAEFQPVDRSVAAGSRLHSSVNARLATNAQYQPPPISVVSRDGQRQADPDRYEISD
jgi:uncharacterized protein (DUF2235 family)